MKKLANPSLDFSELPVLKHVTDLNNLFFFQITDLNIF